MKVTTILLIMGCVGCIVQHASGQTLTGDSLNAQLGAESTEPGSMFRMGEMRLLYNNWGSKDMGCETYYKIFIGNDGSFGWEFDRGPCGQITNTEFPAPDYPEIEFGLHPFGHLPDSMTPSDTSTTTLLPLQIKDIRSASIKIDQMNINFQNAGSWNICFETWLTTKDPTQIIVDTNNTQNSCPNAEIMVFWGWENGRWPCDQTGNLTAGTANYDYCHDQPGWSCGWRYMQFRMNGGPKQDFNGKLDVKEILNWIVANKGISQDLWVTRLEVGTEIGDNTKGTLTIKNLTFEVNGESRSPEFYDPSTKTGKQSDEFVSLKQDGVLFPAGASVEIVNMQGARIVKKTGASGVTSAVLSRTLSRGVYLMYPVDRNGIRSKNAVVVPVM